MNEECRVPIKIEIRPQKTKSLDDRSSSQSMGNV